MKKLTPLFLALLLLPILVEGTVTSTPETLSLELNGTQNITVTFTLINYHNISFNISLTAGSLVSQITPSTTILNPAYPIDINAIITAPVDPGDYTDEIKVMGHNDTEEFQITSIPIALKVPSPQMYHFKQCFYENETEYCASLDLETIQEIVIVNKTENVTVVNFMLDFNLTREFFDYIILGMRNISKDVQSASEEIKKAQIQEQDIYRSALALENFLKNPGNPAWIQIMPINTIQNMTGMDNEQLWSAMNILYSSNKIIQKTEKEMVTYPMGGGIYTQERDVVYIASTERLQAIESSIFTSRIIVVLVVVIFVIIVIIFLKKKFKQRIKF